MNRNILLIYFADEDDQQVHVGQERDYGIRGTISQSY